MVASAHSDALSVEDGANIVRMDAVELERHYGGLVACRADETDAVDFAQPLRGVLQQFALVRGDTLDPDAGDVIDRRA